MKVILLNFDYTTLDFISIKKAIKLIYLKKAEIIEYSEKLIRSVENSFQIPKSIRLFKYVSKLNNLKVPFSKKAVLFRDKNTCQYCGSKENLTIDHIIPKIFGGKSSFLNCVTACLNCNNYKGNKLIEKTSLQLKQKPFEPTILQFKHQKIKEMYDYC